MITLVDNGVIAKYIGLSTDEKPQEISSNTGMKNGSRFIEIDTGDKWYYDADSSEWVKQPSESGGGSGGGGSDSVYIVNFTASYDEDLNDYTYTADKSVVDIYNAVQSGKLVFATSCYDYAPEDIAQGYHLLWATDTIANFMMTYGSLPEYSQYYSDTGFEKIIYTQDGGDTSIVHTSGSSSTCFGYGNLTFVLDLSVNYDDSVYELTGFDSAGQLVSLFRQGARILFTSSNERYECYKATSSMGTHTFDFYIITSEGTIYSWTFTANGQFATVLTAPYV